METPNVYHYEAATGRYLGSTTSEASPRQPGVYLVPAFATLEAPPAGVAAESLRWDGTSWHGDAQETARPVDYRISKDAIWRRASDEEAEQMEAALAAQPIRLRRIYEGATHLQTGDELFTLLQGCRHASQPLVEKGLCVTLYSAPSS